MRPRMVDPEELTQIEDSSKKVSEKIESNFIEIVDIPSKFKFYPSGTKLYGRPLRLSEIKKLTTMNENNYNIILKDVLSSSIKGISIEDICVADKIYLIFWLRANTYKNSNFITSYICEHCGRKTEYTFDLDCFEINYVPDDFELAPLRLLNKNVELTLDFLRIRDEDTVIKFQESLKNGLASYDEDTIMIASMIKAIDGKKINIRQACEFINSLEDFPEDYAYLVSYVTEVDFGIVREIKAVCNYKDCREVNKVPVSFRPEFFIPKYKF